MKGESRASQRISSTQERPMPAMSLWWRSSGCRWRGWSIAAANSASGGGGQASGPRVLDHLVLGDRVGRQQLRPGPLLGPELAQPQLAPVLAAGPAPARRGLSARPVCRRPAAAPPTSGGSAAPGRRTRPPASSRPAAPRSARRPTSASSGGSKVFITFIPGASADSTTAPDRAASRRRATISTSGSSGMGEVASE